jgi:glycosyltransferase involved in cell wall biosynthesis
LKKGAPNLRIAIVSSYAESCGNASFTSIIKKSLEKNGNDVTVFGLDLFFTQSADLTMARIASQQIRLVANELKKFDGVNLQFEPGLYGPNSKLILKRLRLLLQSNSNTTVTLHSTRYFQSDKENNFRQSLKFLAGFKFKSFVLYLTHNRKLVRDAKINRSYLELMMKNKCKLIVHTNSTFKTLTKFFQYPHVYLHPLKFTDKNSASPSRSTWHQKLQVSDEDILVGVFGYLSAYKGHLTAIEAMRYLPSHYKLVIAGRQHPQTIKQHMSIDPYLKSMIHRIEEIEKDQKGFSERIIFCNEIEEPEFTNLVASVDFAWLPYLEVGQDGSGIASIIFDCAQKILASNSKAFDELLLLEDQYQCERFDIGNFLELSGKTLRFNKKTENVQTRFSLDSQASLYQELFKKNSNF